MYAPTVVQTSGSKLAMVKKMKLCPMAEQMEKYRIFCRISGLFRQNCRPEEPALYVWQVIIDFIVCVYAYMYAVLSVGFNIQRNT